VTAAGRPRAGEAIDALRACRARDTVVEGIEMFLVLDDLTGPPAGEPAPEDVAEGRRLAVLGERYADALRAEAGAGDEARVLLDAIEVLAARHFERQPDA
jgi:hypothetical protein